METPTIVDIRRSVVYFKSSPSPAATAGGTLRVCLWARLSVARDPLYSYYLRFYCLWYHKKPKLSSYCAHAVHRQLLDNT